MTDIKDLFARAIARHNAGAWEEAAALYGRVLALAPANAGVLGNHGAALQAGGDPAAAAAVFGRAARSAPDQPGPWFNLGNARRTLGDDAGATAAFRRAVAARPDHPGAVLALGDRLLAADRLEEAERWLERATAMQPANAAALYRLGRTRQRRGQVAAAEAPLEAALAAKPDLLAAAEALAECRFLLDDFVGGAARFHRYQNADSAWLAKLRVPGPVDRLAPGARLLMVADSGFGDTLQLVRYAAWFAARGHWVAVECQSALVRLAGRAAGVSLAMAVGGERPPVDAVVPLHSLPHLAGVGPDELLPFLPCLTAEPELADAWRRRLEAEAGGALRVGVVWAGAPDGAANRGRSPRLRPLLPLLELPGVRFFGLQLGDGRHDLDGTMLPGAFSDLGPEIADFADTAAILTGLDLLVTSDTSVAHLAGGLGVPMSVLLPCVPAWRWGLEGTTTPWYPTARLYRQPSWGDWETPVGRLAADLRRRAGVSRRGPGG
ncbi:tetratricopeptide repeat protein [Azospirillum sp. ST 5-10]|uniref:tetratricopeptide repeat protein n=1 Tax=unclassified Azospirillum TaxID=2630922 RepID=UPI003F49DCDA